MNVQPFNAQAKTISITVPNGSASTSTALPGQGSVVQCVNSGTGTAYVAIGMGVQTAVAPSGTPQTGCLPVLAGEIATYSIPNDQVYNISAYGGAASTLLVSVGEGQ